MAKNPIGAIVCGFIAWLVLLSTGAAEFALHWPVDTGTYISWGVGIFFLILFFYFAV